MNELDKTNRAIDGNSAWGLTNEWIGKVEKAYDDYNASKSRVVRAILLVVLSWFSIMVGMFLLEALKKNIVLTDLLLHSDWAIDFIDVMAVCVAIMLLFYLANRIQQHRLLKNELADLFAISHDLFQMVVASEEQNAGNKYEYLVNHVRILEIQHLLKKVAREVGHHHAKST